MKQRRFQFSNLGITQGVLVVFGLQLGFSLVYLLSNLETRATIAEWLVASPSQVFEHGKVWTLLTSPLIEINFIALLLLGFMSWMFFPTLERFWGTARFYRFVIFTSVAGTLGGTLVGHLIGQDAPIAGLSPFVYAAFVAFGIVYGKQKVQFFGVLPLTGRQMMFGILGFLVLFVVLQKFWALGAGYAAAMATAAILVSKKLSPGLAWKRWRIARARAKLTVMQGGVSSKKPKGQDEQKYLN